MDWLATMSTTKRVNNVDCPRHAFAYSPDDNPENWSLPIWIPGDEKKTLNALKTSLYRFDSAKIPDCEKPRVFDTIRGALLSHGIDTDRRTFAANSDAPTPRAELTPTAPVNADPEIAEAVALADFRATELLRSLGLE